MSTELPQNLKVQLGYFQGDAPSETISLWRTILNAAIQVHEATGIGVKTYLINEFPEGFNHISYAEKLKELGIPEAKSVFLIEGTKLRKGWNDFIDIGPEVAIIPKVLA